MIYMDMPIDSSKILVIDDEPDFRELIQSQLEIQGYSVLTAGDGEAGLELAIKESPDLIICDIRMPNRDGYSVLSTLRKEKNMAVPIIMLSALNEFNDIRKAYDGETDLYLTKPVQLEVLFKNVRTLLNLKGNSAGS